MEEGNFIKFQMSLMKFYFRYYKWLGSKKSENELELEFIEKYSRILRKLNDVLQKLKLKL